MSYNNMSTKCAKTLCEIIEGDPQNLEYVDISCNAISRDYIDMLEASQTRLRKINPKFTFNWLNKVTGEFWFMVW